jgi:puromycin-sensitive aminopeptidase
VLAAIVNILAQSGDAARYEEFLGAFRAATTPQEERRYLFSLAAFRDPVLHDRTLALTLNGEIRTQDGPFVINAMLMSVYARERTWAFVKDNWDKMDQVFPKSGMRRLCGGVVGLATPELEQDLRQFFADRKIDFGGKTLAQYCEQLRIWVTLRERDGQALSEYLMQGKRQR